MMAKPLQDNLEYLERRFLMVEELWQRSAGSELVLRAETIYSSNIHSKAVLPIRSLRLSNSTGNFQSQAEWFEDKTD